ncbi:MAG: sulfur carrier protein ThiS [Oscillospiraceae bacterium]|nr:sulfur carrier protein ThiS [Oscillospiraceae bacterium]
MLLNGKEMHIDCEKSLCELLIDCGYQLSAVAVLKNGEIISKNEISTVNITDNDTVEVVSFVGGG